MEPSLERIYYALKYRLDQSERFLLWYSDERDGVVLDERGHVPSLGNLDSLQRWAHTQGWEAYTEEPILHDLDMIEQWSELPSPETVDCVAVLNAWNLFIDIRASIEQRNVLRDDPENNDLYDEVFYGNNLPAMTPPGKHYIPAWSGDEVVRLSGILTEGLRLFRARVSPAGINEVPTAHG